MKKQNPYQNEKRITVTNKHVEYTVSRGPLRKHIHLKRGTLSNRAWLKINGGKWIEYPSVEHARGAI
jgi:hypothetical protein